jgi:thioesterase domain-containing protein
VAFEMACQLRAAGEAIEILILLDSGVPLRGRALKRRARRRLDVISDETSVRSVQGAAVVGARVVREFAGSVYARAERRVVATSAGVLSRRGIVQYDAFYRLHGVMARKYRPTAKFDGRIVVLRASASDDLGWSTLTTGPVEVITVPGDHNGLLRIPAVYEVGRTVSKVLAESQV